jgi:hypothetical protein
MVETILVEQLIRDGETFLRELDRQNFPVEAMFWINTDGYFRLIIGSKFVAQEGTRAGYRRLSEIYATLDLLGLALEDITLLDPQTKPFLSLRSAAGHSSRLSSGSSWIQYSDAVVYRWNDAFLKGTIACSVTVEDLNRFWNVERKLSNLPRLLIDLNDHEVTLRFHPDHGGLGGIQDIKPSFQIAMHRPTARPDCNITWPN